MHHRALAHNSEISFNTLMMVFSPQIFWDRVETVKDTVIFHVGPRAQDQNREEVRNMVQEGRFYNEIMVIVVLVACLLCLPWQTALSK